ncbi:MAG: class I tRNA ligase family protein, partial [Promethearchaeota archaeon]
PAIEIIEKMGITNQNDPQVETATKTIYKKEFHAGITTEITGKYAGTPVRDIKDVLINDFIEENIATVLYESSEKVVCRCGTTCHVKMFKDQWFLKFGDVEWKEKVRNHVEQMLFLPPEGKASFDYTIDWLHDKACTRRSGLGTPLPWDPTWIVETLSDSTIYMAYYTLAKYVTSGDLTVEQATVEFFNYIFRGIGDANSISQQINMPKDKLDEMRAEFCYWYPMDIRISGKDLIHNHLTFCLFHHAALFDTDLQPRGMGVNGHMSVEGQKMSKSKGVLTPLNEATQIFGADLTRIGLLGAGENLSDAKFAETDVRSYARWLESLYRYSKEKPVSQEMNFIDHWLLSRLQTHISVAEGHAENLRTRSYLQTVLFDLINDLRWYRRRSFEIGPAFPEAVETAIRLLTPITPHFSEEIWETSEKTGFIATAPYPEADVGKKAPLIETQDLFLRSVMDDIDKIRQALKKDQFSRIDIIIPSQWMYTVRDMAEESKDDLIKRIMQVNEIKSQGKRAISYAQKILKSPTEFSILTRENEENALTSAKDFLSQHYSTEINVLFAENSDSSKAQIAEPGRPGINFILVE